MERWKRNLASYDIQATTIWAIAISDRMIATNDSGFLFVTRQVEAVAIATVKQETALPIFPLRRLALSRSFKKGNAGGLRPGKRRDFHHPARPHRNLKPAVSISRLHSKCHFEAGLWV